MNIEQRRREAAWICFEPYLSEEQRLQAIQILELGFQADGAINLMAYIAKICLQFGINLQHRNYLCSRFQQLVSETVNEGSLTVIEEEPVSEAVAEPPLLDETILPIAEVEKSAHVIVFESFMRAVLEYIPNKIEFFTVLLDLVSDKKLKMLDLVSPLGLWLNNRNDFAWAELLSQDTLTRLVHLVYMGSCEVLGPVATDEYFHKALVSTERLPEAKIFAPAQFL